MIDKTSREIVEEKRLQSSSDGLEDNSRRYGNVRRGGTAWNCPVYILAGH